MPAIKRKQMEKSHKNKNPIVGYSLYQIGSISLANPIVPSITIEAIFL
jgi:hypothetical protein